MYSEQQLQTIDEHGRPVDPRSPFLVFELSWVAHLANVWSFIVRLFLCTMAFSLLSLGLDHLKHMHTQKWLPLLGPIVAFAWIAYTVAFTRSIRLFTNEGGVWAEWGVFPWQRGVSGVQWRDVGQAGYTQGFLSWACKSYDVQVTHRFTKTSELYLRNVRFGDHAVGHINSVMAELQRRTMFG